MSGQLVLILGKYDKNRESYQTLGKNSKEDELKYDTKNRRDEEFNMVLENRCVRIRYMVSKCK